MSTCAVCGHVDGACKGRTPTNQRQIITSSGLVAASGPERVRRPRHTRLGREGYVGEGTGKLEYYDPEAPHIVFVSDVEEEPADAGAGSGEEDAGPKPKRGRRKKAGE